MFKKFFVIILLFSAVFTGCKDDPITPQSEHLEAIGMSFYSSGIKVAQILRGETTDTLFAPVGGLGDHIDIKFIDEDENEFDPPTDGVQTLSWEFDNSNIAGIWQHEGEEGGFAFHIQGKLVGETNIEFFVLHNDHKDYTSGKIPIKIINEDSTYGVPIGFDLADEESGNILVQLNGQTVIGQLSVNQSDTTDHMELTFFDANGNHFQPSAPPHSLNVVSGDSTKLGIIQATEYEPWSFKIFGKQSGSTTITVQIYHDENLGLEFVPVNVIVN